jgi:hypothetical protein
VTIAVDGSEGYADTRQRDRPGSHGINTQTKAKVQEHAVGGVFDSIARNKIMIWGPTRTLFGRDYRVHKLDEQ